MIRQQPLDLLRDRDGKPYAFLVTHTDLTERKLLEAKFLRAQRLESVGALASGIAHDLNNVFTPIMMTAQLLGDPLDRTTRNNMLGVLLTSARRGSEMVKQVLTFARGDESGSVPRPGQHLLKELEQMMRDTLPAEHRIERNIPSDLHLVRGDATQLYQVFLNLCVNARDAMPSGGVLRLEAANVDVEASGDKKSRPARLHNRFRHRHRHDAGSAEENLRAVLHHQRRWQRHRSWPVHGDDAGQGPRGFY